MNRRRSSKVVIGPRKKRVKPSRDVFQALPDDVVTIVIGHLYAGADSPKDVVNIRMTSKRMNRLGKNPSSLARIARNGLEINPGMWSDSARRYLEECASAENDEASYILGMIEFYCLGNKEHGASLMASAGVRHSHPQALYSLAVIQFNKGQIVEAIDDRIPSAVMLWSRAARLGHVPSLYELSRLNQDGYEVMVVINIRGKWAENPIDFLEEIMGLEPHPAHRFMVGWYWMRGGASGSGSGVCCNFGCGRPETQEGEFKCCSDCGKVGYCSHACQAMDWKMRHDEECEPDMYEEFVENYYIDYGNNKE